MNKEQQELYSINRDLIDIMERLKPLQSEEAKTVYELLNVATDCINGDMQRGCK